VASGTASWYGTKFHGQNTANGEVYDLYGMSAAHKTLPLPSYVKVTNLDNNRSVILRVNDRGPFYSDRIIDLSYAAAKKLGYAETGTARVKVEGIDPQQWWAQRGRP
ncbi:septal ring lytic transglycosylase RlpA family protein, partial [Pseudomonas sp. SIMBA_077]